MGQLSMDERRQLTRRLIDNLEHNADIRSRLTRIATDADAEYLKGMALLETLEARILEQGELEGKVAGKWDALYASHTAVWKLFTKHRSRAIDEIESVELIKTLELHELQARTRPPQLLQMRDFYAALLKQPQALTILAESGLTSEKLRANQARITTLEERESDIFMTENLKQTATKAQHDALEAMDAWREDLYDRIELVTKDAPHLRKAVGLTVRE